MMNIIYMIITSFIVGISLYLRIAFNVDFEAMVYTLANKTEGYASNVIYSGIKHILFIFVLLITLFLIANYIKGRLNNVFFIKNFNRFLLLLSTITLFFDYMYFGIGDYLLRKNKTTTIYEENYINPNDVKIEGIETKNIILLYLESMESSYANVEDNIIPNLYDLALNNQSFRYEDTPFGGFNSTTGTTWTMGALLGTTSGIPFNFPVGQNEMERNKTFAEKVVCLGDILNKDNYYQEFLCGSDSSFAGRDIYYKTHKYDKIYDLNTAIENGKIKDKVWWGFDDKTLYEIAKEELTNISKYGKKFNFTMLTVDTHPTGYVCEKCKNEYENEYENVIKCADNQAYEFIEWIKKQDFYENTVIVVCGDHVSMDGKILGNDQRYVFNCFINSSSITDNIYKSCNSLDMFPTILASMGYTIEGNRLGLGTNLFSNEETLQEKYGSDYLEEELGKYSSYYEENFY